jgi:putative transposase
MPMKRVKLEELSRRSWTSKQVRSHTIFTHPLRKLPLARPNQIWGMDITYIPMARGFVYLAAVVDWFSRRLLT